MFEYYDLHEGIYHVQSGFRNKTAIIECPYLTEKIEVYDAPNLQILDGARVYWRELRKFYVTKKHTQRQELVINGAVVGLKHCQYFHDGINIICTLFQDKNKS